MNRIYDLVIANKQKAIVGFVVAAAVSYAAQYGLNLETLTVKEALELVAYGAIGFLGVYIKKNQ